MILTLGEAGAWVEGDNVSELVPAPTVRATATVGAGDALKGGVAAALVLGQDLARKRPCPGWLNSKPSSRAVAEEEAARGSC